MTIPLHILQESITQAILFVFIAKIAPELTHASIILKFILDFFLLLKAYVNVSDDQFWIPVV